MTNYVLYHANCLDGLGAAYSAWKRLGAKDTLYIPVQYGKDFPDIKVQTTDTVYILDFSYPHDVIKANIPETTEIVVIDHHESAKDHHDAIMADLDRITMGVFEIRKSGAVLAWEWFMGSVPVPMLLRHIQDRDLWKFELPSTRAILTGLRATTGYTNFEVLDSMMYTQDGKECSEYLKVLAFKGSILNEYDDHMCDSFARAGSEKIAAVHFMGHKTALYNTTTLISDIGAAVLRNGQGYDIAMSYFVTSDLKMVFNLRSDDKGANVDVGDIAKCLGGGGHHNAAGFSVSLDVGAGLVQTLTNDDSTVVFIGNTDNDSLEILRARCI